MGCLTISRDDIRHQIHFGQFSHAHLNAPDELCIDSIQGTTGTGADHQDFGAIATALALKRFRFGDGGVGDRGENNKTSMNFGFWIWF